MTGVKSGKEQELQQQKTVSISSALFSYICLYFAAGDKTPELENLICQELQKKIEAVKRRGLYTQYKSADSRAERENARQQYLDLVGYNSDFLY